MISYLMCFRFMLYFKLFMVMGVNWMPEVLSMMLKDYTFLEYLWIITDLANALQGLIIFIIFVCQKKVWKLVVQKFFPGYLHCFNHEQNDTESSNDSSCSAHEINNTVELISENVQNSNNLLNG